MTTDLAVAVIVYDAGMSLEPEPGDTRILLGRPLPAPVIRRG